MLQAMIDGQLREPAQGADLTRAWLRDKIPAPTEALNARVHRASGCVRREGLEPTTEG